MEGCLWIIHLNRISHYKPFILWYLHFSETHRVDRFLSVDPKSCFGIGNEEKTPFPPDDFYWNDGNTEFFSTNLACGSEFWLIFVQWWSTNGFIDGIDWYDLDLPKKPWDMTDHDRPKICMFDWWNDFLNHEVLVVLWCALFAGKSTFKIPLGYWP